MAKCKQEAPCLESIETRIGMLRDESRLTSHKIEHLTERRKDINKQITFLKELAADTKKQREECCEPVTS